MTAEDYSQVEDFTQHPQWDDPIFREFIYLTQTPTPDYLLQHLGADENSSVREGLALLPNLTPELYKTLLNYGDATLPLIKNPSAHPYITPEIAERIHAALSDSLDLKQSIADNPDTAPAVLTALTTDDDAAVRRTALHNPSCPPDPLSTAAETAETRQERMIALHHQNTPADTLTKLSQSKQPEDRLIAAQHHNTPTALIEELAQDPVWLVRAAAARNPKTPPPVLAALATDPEKMVRRNTARNTHTPPGSLFRLTRDPEQEVAASAADNPAYKHFRRFVANKVGIPTTTPAQVREQQIDHILTRKFLTPDSPQT